MARASRGACVSARAPATASRWQGIVLAVLGASAVAMGAFGAHALRDTLPESAMQIWRTAGEYHFWHTLAFALAAMLPGRWARLAAVLFAFGVALFCGSLYVLALGPPFCDGCGQHFHYLLLPLWAINITGFLTPLGGVAFILGWIALGIALMRQKRESN